MIDKIKAFVDGLTSPWLIFIAASVGLGIYLVFARFFSKLWVGLTLLVLTTGFFVVSTFDANFRKIVTAPDNVPIVGTIFLVGFFTWFAIRKGVLNDERMAKGQPTFE